jgi:hypothetical protein
MTRIQDCVVREFCSSGIKNFVLRTVTSEWRSKFHTGMRSSTLDFPNKSPISRTFVILFRAPQIENIGRGTHVGVVFKKRIGRGTATCTHVVFRPLDHASGTDSRLWGQSRQCELHVPRLIGMDRTTVGTYETGGGGVISNYAFSFILSHLLGHFHSELLINLPMEGGFSYH